MARIQVAITLLAIVLLPVTVALAQTSAMPPVPPPTPPGAGADGAAGITVLAIVVGLIVVVGIGVKLYDLKRKRDSEAVALQAQVSDALLREPSLFGLPITPTARVPTWSGSPALIEVAGQVPTPEAREAALKIIRDEASRIRPDFRIEDRTAVVPSMVTRRVA